MLILAPNVIALTSSISSRDLASPATISVRNLMAVHNQDRGSTIQDAQVVHSGAKRLHIYAPLCLNDIPWLKQQVGLLGYYPGKPLSEKSREYSMLSLWENIDALKQAVGEDWERVVLLEDEAGLVEETSVEHFEYFDAPKA